MPTRIFRRGPAMAVVLLSCLVLAALPHPARAQQPAGLVTVAPLVSSTAYESSRVLKAGPGSLLFLCGYNSGPTQFVQVFNAAAVPANGATPTLLFQVPAGNFSLAVPLSGMPFSAGIAVGNSTTGQTRTAGAADCWFNAVVK